MTDNVLYKFYNEVVTPEELKRCELIYHDGAFKKFSNFSNVENPRDIKYLKDIKTSLTMGERHVDDYKIKYVANFMCDEYYRKETDRQYSLYKDLISLEVCIVTSRFGPKIELFHDYAIELEGFITSRYLCDNLYEVEDSSIVMLKLIH